MSRRFKVHYFGMKLEKFLEWLLCGFLFLLPWQTIYIFQERFLGTTKIESWTQGFYATEILLWVIVGVFMGWFWREKKLKKIEIEKFSFSKDRIFVLSVLVFLLYIFSSIFWAFDKSLALQQSLRIMEMFLVFFIFWLSPPAGGLNFEKAVKWLLYGSILPCILGIGQFLMQADFAFKWLGLSSHPAWQAGTSIISSDSIGRWLRAYGPFAHPNIFGGYIVVVFVLSQFLKNRKFLFTFYFLLLSSLFFTFSRSAWLTAFVLLIYFFGYYKDTRKLILKSLLPVLILFILFFPLVQTRFSNESISEVRSTTERVSGYKEAWQIFKANPIFGVGAGNYTLAVYNLNSNLQAWEIQPVHNVGVLFLVESGVVGLILFLCVLVVFFKYQITDNRYQILNKDNRIVFMLSVICYLLLGFFDHYLYSSYTGLVLSGVFFGLIMRNFVVKSVSTIHPLDSV